MKYPIDAYFLNKQNEVMAVVKNLKPNRFSPVHFGAHSVLEFSSGVERNCRVGDRLSLKNKKGQATVELTLTVVIFLAFVLILGDMVRVCYDWVCLQYATNEAARFGGLGKTSSEITDQVTTVAGNLGVKDVTVSFVGGTPGGGRSTFYRVLGQTTVTLNPLSSLFLKMTGDYSGDYIVKTEALTRNAAA